MSIDSSGNVHRGAGTPDGGQFAGKTNSAPAAGLEEASAPGNSFADRWDADPDNRPLRPYLPLGWSDDDEFSDAPDGSVLTVAATDGESEPDRYIKTGAYEWQKHQLAAESTEPISAGELWASLFSRPEAAAGLAESGDTMRSAMLSAPVGWLYSDKHYWCSRDQADRSIPPAEAEARLDGATLQMVSYRLHRPGAPHLSQDGLPVDMDDELHATATDGYLQIRGYGPGSFARTVRLGGEAADEPRVYDRGLPGSDIALRRTLTDGSEWEEVYRLVRAGR